MLSAEFEPAIPASERPLTHASASPPTEIGREVFSFSIKTPTYKHCRAGECCNHGLFWESYTLWANAACSMLARVKVKVRFTLYRAMKPQRRSRGIALFYLLPRRWMWVNATPRPLYLLEWPGTHYIGGWMGPRAGLDGCGRSRSYRDSIPAPPRS